LRFWIKLFLIGFLIVLGVCLVHDAFGVTYQDAAGQVTDASQALQDAFKSVVDAEQKGANVSLLLSRLDEAGSNLTWAEAALAVSNYSDAVSFAGVCKSEADLVGVDAVGLGNDAVLAVGNWWIMVVFSVVGAVVFLAVLFVVWRFFKRGYLKRVMHSRPEVTS
jgi:hypothetical protein